MKGMSDTGLMLLISLALGLAILWATTTFTGTAQQVKIPATDFFGQLGRLFGLVEQKVGLFGERTQDFLCAGELDRFIERCDMPRDKVEEVCKLMPEEIIAYCQVPPKDMQRFCGLGLQDRDTLCNNVAGVYRACDYGVPLAKAGKVQNMLALPFCAGFKGK
jgi:hypothetical protein